MPKLAREKEAAPARWFNRFAARTACLVGSPWAFLLAFASLVIWFRLGSVFHWSDAWQLVINRVTNILTCLVVFLIQYSQTRDSDAINLKLNELIAPTASLQ